MKVALLGSRQEAVEALAAAGHRITVVHDAWEARRAERIRAKVDRIQPVDSYDNVDSVAGALERAGLLDCGIDAIVSVVEHGIVSAAAIGMAMGCRSMPLDTAIRGRDKVAQKRSWEAAGIPTARFASISKVT